MSQGTEQFNDDSRASRIQPKAVKSLSMENKALLSETHLLRDTLDLLWNRTLDQRKVCEKLQQENEYLEDYINNMMSSSNVLEK